jgi:hypothetical protein
VQPPVSMRLDGRLKLLDAERSRALQVPQHRSPVQWKYLHSSRTPGGTGR